MASGEQAPLPPLDPSLEAALLVDERLEFLQISALRQIASVLRNARNNIVTLAEALEAITYICTIHQFDVIHLTADLPTQEYVEATEEAETT